MRTALVSHYIFSLRGRNDNKKAEERTVVASCAISFLGFIVQSQETVVCNRIEKTSRAVDLHFSFLTIKY